MNRKLFLVTFLMLLCSTMFGQNYHWTVNSDNGNYASNFTIDAVIQLDGELQNRSNLELGVFSGETCYATAMTENFGTGKYIAELVVYGEIGHVYTLKLYDHESSTTYSDNYFIKYQDGAIEDLLIPYITDYDYGTITNPAVINFKTPNHYTPNTSDDEGNMSLTAVVLIDGVEQHNSNWEVGAFCGDICKGSAKANLVDTNNGVTRNYAKMVIGGSENEVITFKLYNHETKEELFTYDVTTINYQTGDDASLGTILDPQEINFITKPYIAKIGEIKYTSLDEAFAAAQDGTEIVIIREGEYILNTSGKNLIITGHVDADGDADGDGIIEAVVFNNIGAKNMDGANVTFNNVTFTYAENSTYQGLQHSGNLVYNNCTFNGQVFLYGQSETFNNCIFNTTDSDNYNVWTYGAKEVAFNECTFNSAGKSVLIYAESASIFNNVTVTACTFIASTPVEGKAAIEMDSSLTRGINLTISNTTAEGFGSGNVSRNSLWNNKKGNATAANNDITVVVDDVTVLAPVFEAQIGDIKYRSIQEAVNAAIDGQTIIVIKDHELTAQNAQNYFKPAYNRESYCGIVIPDDKTIVLDLNGHTVSYVDAYGDVDNVMVMNLGNLTINDAVGGGKLTYKAVAGAKTYTYFYSTIFNCGTLTINAGTVENTCETETDVTNAVDNHSRLSHEYGNDCMLTVNGGTLNGAYYYAIRQYTHYLEGVKNRVTINGGDINGGIYMQHGDSWYYADPTKNRLNVDCFLTINGGNINIDTTLDQFGKIKSRLSNPDNNAFGLEINGGNINVPVELLVQRGVYYTNGVSGATTPAEPAGTRNAEWLAKNGGFVKGGVYKELGVEGTTTDLKSFLAAGHQLKDNGNDTYSIVKGTLSVAYTTTDGYWGECGGNANDSFELKFYNDNTYMGSTSLNDVDNIIDGDVYVTWSMKLDAASTSNWTMSWTVAPTIAMQPNRVEQWIDGVKVAESAIQPNGPDNLNPIVAAVAAGENRVIKSYATSLTNAVAAAEGNTVVLFRDINETLTVVKPTNNITIDGNGKTVQGGMSFGSDDNKLDNHSIAVLKVNFVGKGISVSELTSVAISDNTFTGITEGNAITVVCDGLTETVNVKGNTIKNVEKGHAVRIRNAKAVVVDGNNIDGVFNSAILLEGTTSGDVAVTNNVLKDWGKDAANNGRAIRIVKGAGTTATITGNAMMHENAPEEFVKVSSNTENVNINENYWNGSNPDETAGLYDVLNVYPENYYSEYENGELKNLVTLSYVAQIGAAKYTTLQKAIDAVQNGQTIVFVKDITENVTLTEKDGLYYTIDGNNKTMNGNITIAALSDTNDNRRITIKGINFKNETAAEIGFIQSEMTNHYPRLTVDGCSFTGSGDATDVAVRLKSAYSATIKNCTGTGLHSFLQNTSGLDLTIENVKVTNSKSGLALGTVQGVTVKDCNIDVNGYGIRMDANTYNNNAVIESNTVKAFIPVVVRKANAVSKIKFQGTNTMNYTNEDGLWCAIGTSEYETNGTLPTPAEGKVRVEIVNSENLPQSGLYGNHIEGTHSAAYVGTDRYWGECGGWANYSFELKFYNGNAFMGSTSLNDVDNIIDGDVYVTWSMKLDAASTSNWTMSWTVAPTIAMQPNRVEQWIDGVKVAESAIQPNGPDNLNPIVAAVAAGENRVIKSYATSLTNAVAAAEGNTVVLFRDINETLTVVKPTNNITIDGNGKTVQGGMSFGSDDNKLDNHSIAVLKVNFVGKGISVSELTSVAISDNTFTGITEGNAITVVCDGLTETVNVKGNTIKNVEKGHAVRIRNAKAVVVDGNNIDGVFNSAILLEGTTSGDVAVTNNVLKDWGKDAANNGRAIRIVKGAGTTATITGNAMMHENAPEEFVKVSSNTENVNINENYWNGSNPDETAGLYDVLNVYPENYYSEYENGELKNLVTLSYVAQIGAAKYTTLQKAIDAVQNGQTIVFVKDITENVTLTEKDGLYYTIDGNNKTMNGNITIAALSDTNDNRRITIKGINFKNETAAEIGFIQSEMTNHYPRLTVDGCSFTGSGDATDVAVRLKSAYSATIKNCTGTGLHSFLQNTSGLDLTIENVKVTNSKSGLALGTVQGVTVKDCNIDVNGYGIRMDANTYNNNAVIESNTVKAFIPVVVRKANAVSKIKFQGTNTMTQTNNDGYWCVIGTSEYEVNGQLPTAATGKVIVTLNDDNLSMTGVYGNYYEATIDGTQYIAIKDAFDAAENGDEIVVARDINIEETINVAAGQNITLDLNGCTVSMTDSSSAVSALIKNNGNLTITGEEEGSKLSFATTTPSAANAYASNTISNYGTITVLSGIIENTSVGGACYALDNYAGSTATIVGGKLIAKKTTLRIFNWTDGDAAKATLKIQGGEIVSNDGYGVNLNLGNSPYVDLNITGGTITTNDTDYNLAVYVVNKNSAENVNINVEGGIFNGNFALNGLTATTMVEGKVSISGGTFEGVICYDTPAYGFITGGTFGMDVNEYCHEYYDAIEYEDGIWTVERVLYAQTTSLNRGWNWYSSYINLSSDEGLVELQDALDGKGIEIKGKTGYSDYQYIGEIDGVAQYKWYKTDDFIISAKQMYMIKTTEAVEIMVDGKIVDPATTPITLRPGWNWIGYPVAEDLPINVALAVLDAEDGDVIKWRTGQAQYKDDINPNTGEIYGWTGSLQTLEAGQGYKYKSNKSTYFTYSTNVEGAKYANENITTDNNYWVPQVSQYANNMTITAMLNIDGNMVKDNYEIAAFANGECRGSARPIFIEGMNAYMLFMTVFGEDVEELTFKCYDINNETEYELNNRVNYSDDAILGSIDEPYMFFMNTLGIEESSLDMINIYPNPTTTDRAINLQATCDNVEVFNALGVKVAEYQNVDSIDALEAAGVYVIRLTINGETRNCRLVVK